MSLMMSYSCRCGFRSKSLQEAQEHVNAEQEHIIDIRGTLSTNVLRGKINVPQSVEEKMREGAILRRAREKGLL